MKLDLTNNNNTEKSMGIVDIIDRRYFVPDISDIRVGYEYERYIAGSDTQYEKLVFNGDLEQLQFLLNCFKQNLQEGWLRVPYLTKEQITAEGWREIHWREYLKTNKNGQTIHFSNGQKEDEHDTEYLSVFSVHHKSIIFQGECKSINEFRWICKLLGI